MALELTDKNFEEKALKTDKVVMIDFWAAWCGPCRALSPIVEQMSEDYKGKAIIGKIDVDNNANISQKYKIRSLPTILFLKNGEILEKHVGSTSASVLKEKLEAHL